MEQNGSYSIDFRNSNMEENPFKPLFFDWKLRRREKPKILCNRYLMGEKLAFGDFTEIFEILDITTLHRRVAKVYHLERLQRLYGAENYLKFLKIEFKVSLKMNHKNVVRFLEATEDLQTLTHAYLIMEHCTTSIDKLIKLTDEKKLPVYQSRKYFIDLIDGLEYLHSIGIVHRDIKPQNVLITNANVAKISDFGICEEIDRYGINNRSVHQFGTAIYMAPEIIHSCDVEEHFLDGFKIDIWSSGVTLYEMITGKLPFDYTFNWHASKDDDFIVTDELFSNTYLYDFFSKVFIKDPQQRIDLNGIKRHPWINQQMAEKMVKLNTANEEYDSLTMTSQLHELHYPLKDEENIVTVPDKNFNQFNKLKRIPLIRSNRTIKKRAPYRPLNITLLLYTAILKFIRFTP